MPRPATFGIWTELRPGGGRQPDPGFYAERLEEAVLAEQLGLAAVWGSEHHAVEDGHLSAERFEAFVFSNAVRLHGGMNPAFFDGTPCEKEARAVLSG